MCGLLAILAAVATLGVNAGTSAPSAAGAPAALRGAAGAGVGANASAGAGEVPDLAGLRPLALAAARGGCVRIERFVVENRCSKTLELKGWSQRVPPGAEVAIGGRHHDDVARISWRLQGGPAAYDYIELNGAWSGAGSELCAHPNYASWFGFTTSSRYEALDPQTGGLACADAGAEVTFKASTCPTRATGSFACDFHATQESIRNCASPAARYQQAHTSCINGDGSRSPRCACSPRGGWCGNWVNYPCAPESSDWPHYGVGTWIDCTERRKAIVLKLTVCI